MPYEMKIKEINIRNFMCFDKVDLQLNTDKYCIVITGEQNGCGKTALMTAVRFITDPEYNDMKSASALRSIPSKSALGLVRITFLYKASEDSDYKELIVRRSFSSIDLIYYSINNKNFSAPIDKFQIALETNLKSSYPYIDLDFKNIEEHYNILHHVILKLNSFTCEDLKQNIDNAFLQTTMAPNDDENLGQFLQIALQQQRLNMLKMKTNVFKVFITLTKSIDKIFQQLTSASYSVHFLIEVEENNLLELNSEIFDNSRLHNIITFVQFGDQKILWTMMEAHLKYLLKVAVKLSLASYYNQKFVFLDDVYMLKATQNLHLAKAIVVHNYLPEVETLSNASYNYLQNLVNVCNELKITALLESRNTIFIENANIIHCEYKRGTAQCYLCNDQFILNDLITILKTDLDL